MAWEVKQSITNGRLLRAPAGVSGAVSVYRAPTPDATWTHTFDFLTSDEGWAILPSDPRGTWINGTGWRGTLNGLNNQIHIYLDLPYSAFITSFTINFTFQNGAASGGDAFIFAQYKNATTTRSNTNTYPYPSGAQSKTTTGDLAHTTRLELSTSVRTNTTTQATFTSATVEGTGFDPFESYDPVYVNYCTDNGDTMTELEVSDFAGDEPGYDVDDFAGGVHVAAAARGVWYTDSYTGTFAELTGLTGVDGDAYITCIRVPYKKLLTQELNDDPTSLQFIYGTDIAVSGATLWAVTFDASDGSIINQTDITPIISGTTYYVTGAQALEAAGGYTRTILAFAKPVGGGATKLIRTLGGGSSWHIAQNLDGNFVRWRPGSHQEVWLSGADGIHFSSNRASTIVNRTAGTTGEVLGVIGL